MGTFVNTTIVNYCLSFHDQQTSVFRFSANKQQFVISIFRSKQTEVAFSLSSVFRLRNSRNMKMKTWRMETWKHQMENRKRKPRWFSLTRLPFAHRANGSLSKFVDEETNGSYLFANRLNGLIRFAYLWLYTYLKSGASTTSKCLSVWLMWISPGSGITKKILCRYLGISLKWINC